MKEWLPLGPRARAPGSGPGTRTGPRAGLTAELVGGPALLLIDLNQLKYQIRGPRSWIRCFLLFWLKGSNVLRLPALKMAGRPGRLPRLVNQPLPRPLPAVDYSSLWGMLIDGTSIALTKPADSYTGRPTYAPLAGGTPAQRCWGSGKQQKHSGEPSACSCPCRRLLGQDQGRGCLSKGAGKGNTREPKTSPRPWPPGPAGENL